MSNTTNQLNSLKEVNLELKQSKEETDLKLAQLSDENSELKQFKEETDHRVNHLEQKISYLEQKLGSYIRTAKFRISCRQYISEILGKLILEFTSGKTDDWGIISKRLDTEPELNSRYLSFLASKGIEFKDFLDLITLKGKLKKAFHYKLSKSKMMSMTDHDLNLKGAHLQIEAFMKCLSATKKGK